MTITIVWIISFAYFTYAAFMFGRSYELRRIAKKMREIEKKIHRESHCGHEEREVVQGKEGTAYCAECERKARKK